MDYKDYTHEAIELLKQLISTPSISRDETAAADILADFIEKCGLPCQRIGNNLLVQEQLDKAKPTILLCAHIDTVKPVSSWTRDPFTPTIEGDRLYGLGSNDCGGGLVSMLQAYRILRGEGSEVRGERLAYNLVYLASCEEEVSGANGFSLALHQLPKIDVAIVGEPTGMQPAIAERGLMVIDGVAHGKSGHAARNEGINALYRAMDVIAMLRDFKFPEQSDFLGPVKMTVTMINAGTQHNVIPDVCTFTADIRSNEFYSNHRIFDMISASLPEWCEVKARSLNLNSSRIDIQHPIIQKAVMMGKVPYGSPTLSDQAILDCPSFKMGPGESSRSHTADEFVKMGELEEAVPTYLELLDGLEIC